MYPSLCNRVFWILKVPKLENVNSCVIFFSHVWVCTSLHQCLTCSVDRWHEPEEDGPRVGRQRFLYGSQEGIEVKLASCMSDCCHAGLSLHTCKHTQTGDVMTRLYYDVMSSLSLFRLIVTWYRHSIDSYNGVSQQAAEDSLHLCGGNVLPSPTKRVATAIPEINVAVFIHHQHVT